MTATSVNTNSATLNWNAPATTTWDIYLVQEGQAAPTSSTTPTYNGITTNPIAISSLFADTSYTFYVRVACSPIPSDWSVGYTFTTLVTCIKPIPLTVPTTEITTTQANLYWANGVETDTKWEILLVKAVSPGYGVPTKPAINPDLQPRDILKQIDSPSTAPYLMTGLTPASIYYYYIRTVCLDNDKSTWAGPIKFNTLTCAPADKCNYTFILTDTGNNGWDGARMQVRQNGIVVGSDLGSSMIKQTRAICKDIPFDLYWKDAGIKPQEVGIQILNPSGDPIFTKLPGDSNPLDVLYTSTGNCTTPTCARPESLNIQTLTSNTATLGWSQAGGATKWEVYAVSTGTTPPVNGSAVNQLNVTDKNPFTVTGLEPSSTYDFYVRALCSDSNNSTWTLLSFKTFTTKPVNDDCDSAIVAPVNPGIYDQLTASGNTKGATATLPETNPICQGFADDDVWFSFVATSTKHTIELKNIAGTATDLNHAVYAGSACGTLTQMYCSDPDISLANGLTIGNTYKIRVYTNAYGVAQTATFDVSITTPAPITNDECSSAVELNINLDLVCIASTPGSVTGATASSSANECTGDANDDIWYKFVAKSNTHYVLLNNVIGSSSDLKHAVYSGNCDSLTLKYCSAANSLSSNNNTFVVGETYYVRVWSSATEVQSINFEICLGSIAPPITTSTTQYSKEELVKTVLVGTPCISVSNITYSTGIDHSSSNGIGYFNKSLSAFPFNEGIILSTGSVANAPGPNLTQLNDGGSWWPGDTELEGIVYAATGTTTPKTYNATKLEFDFIAVTDKISFNYLFASEEYGDSQCGLSDAFAFLLTNTQTNATTNLALVPNTTIPVSVLTIRDQKYKRGCIVGPDSVNPEYFGQFYGPNGLDIKGAPTNFNGITVPLKAEATVIPGVTYHIKMVIADNQYFGKDSAVFIEGGSFNVGNIDLGADLLQSTKNALCPGETFVINSGLVADQFTFNWLKDGEIISNETGATFTATVPGTYTVQAHLKNSTCETSDSIAIEYFTNAPAGIPENIVKCDASGKAEFDLTQNSAIILSPFAGDHTLAYYTSLEDAEAQTKEIANLSTFQNTTTPQTIYARVNDTNSICYQILDFTLTVQDLTPVFEVQGEKEICPLESTTITVMPTDNSFNPASVTYTWSFNGDIIPNEAVSSITLSGSSAYGTYAVTVNNSGCVASEDFTISEDTDQFVIDIQSGCSLNNFQLMALPVNDSFDPATSEYLWSAENGESFDSTDKPNTITVRSEGSYNVKITTADGCTSTKSIPLTNIGCTIQKGISPGGNNNAFDLTTLNVTRLEIYNRFGTEVYSLDNYANEWHGQSTDGADLPDGTYFYQVYLADNKVKTGWVYITRKQ